MAKSTYFYSISNVISDEERDTDIKQAIHNIKEQEASAGYRQVTDQLHEMGLIVNHKKVLRSMREMNLLSTAYSKQTRKYNSYKGTVGRIATNRLNRRFSTDRPYQKLTTDITELRWGQQSIDERAYFTCLYDLYSGEVLSYDVSLHPTVEFTTNVLKKGISSIPCDLGYRTTIHSDQGFQYQNNEWIKILKQHQIFQSMSRKATCLDNAAMESFFHIMKSEIYYQRQFKDLTEIKQRLDKWISYYNNFRTKRKLGGKSPVKYRILTTQQAA